MLYLEIKASDTHFDVPDARKIEYETEMYIYYLRETVFTALDAPAPGMSSAEATTLNG